MFTGIVQALLPVVELVRSPGLLRIGLALPEAQRRGLALGASVAVDGVCLTVAEMAGERVYFDAMAETLRKTTLGSLAEGDLVNVERSASVGDEIGGHLVSGHVMGTAEIVAIERPEGNHAARFRVPAAWMKYVLPKGFIALDGASLTVVDTDRARGEFSVWFIPETLRRTTFGRKGVGARVNVEIDARTQAIVDTVEAVLPTMLAEATRG
jgi:riboflavin synthase